jgi:hypothetical protein
VLGPSSPVWRRAVRRPDAARMRPRASLPRPCSRSVLKIVSAVRPSNAVARTVRVRACLQRAYFVMTRCKLRITDLQALSVKHKSAQHVGADLQSSGAIGIESSVGRGAASERPRPRPPELVVAAVAPLLDQVEVGRRTRPQRSGKPPVSVVRAHLTANVLLRKRSQTLFRPFRSDPSERAENPYG